MSLNEIVPGHSHSHSLSTSSSGVSRPDLISAIAEQTTFDQLYIDLTNRAIQAYKYSRRNRCALKLDASLAALEELRFAISLFFRTSLLPLVLLPDSRTKSLTTSLR